MSLDNLNDLPSSIKSDIEVQNCVTTLNNEFNLIKDAIDNINIYSAIDTLPMEIVQLLAWCKVGFINRCRKKRIS